MSLMPPLSMAVLQGDKVVWRDAPLQCPTFEQQILIEAATQIFLERVKREGFNIKKEDEMRTPGPWTRGEEHESMVQIAQVDEHGFCRHICTVHTPVPFDAEGMRANADLIAAAPELLKSLKEMLPYAETAIRESINDMCGSLYPMLLAGELQRAKDVVARAEGETK